VKVAGAGGRQRRQRAPVVVGDRLRGQPGADARALDAGLLLRVQQHDTRQRVGAIVRGRIRDQRGVTDAQQLRVRARVRGDDLGGRRPTIVDLAAPGDQLAQAAVDPIESTRQRRAQRVAHLAPQRQEPLPPHVHPLALARQLAAKDPAR
jgi:hypothetical protein